MRNLFIQYWRTVGGRYAAQWARAQDISYTVLELWLGSEDISYTTDELQGYYYGGNISCK